MDYRVRITGTEMFSEDIMIFSIRKPDGYAFRPGQFCFLTLPDKGFNDEKGLRRHLSIASSPDEKDLLFATKISGSAFKRTLTALPEGAEIVVEPPMGKFFLSEDISGPLVFIAGGIGITPFRSMIRDIDANRVGISVVLFYSVRVPNEAVFLDELQSVAGKKEQIKVVPTMTRVEEGSGIWTGLTGRVNKEMIQEHTKGWRQSLYHIAGPPALAEGAQKMLQGAGIDPKQIRVEKFAGY
jgi:ferredoxin-NADP reductase